MSQQQKIGIQLENRNLDPYPYGLKLVKKAIRENCIYFHRNQR